VVEEHVPQLETSFKEHVLVQRESKQKEQKGVSQA
jgi:hypothetical protein